MGFGLHLKRFARPRRNAFAYGQPETQKGDQQRGLLKASLRERASEGAITQTSFSKTFKKAVL